MVHTHVHVQIHMKHINISMYTKAREDEKVTGLKVRTFIYGFVQKYCRLKFSTHDGTSAVVCEVIKKLFSFVRLYTLNTKISRFEIKIENLKLSI